MSARAILATMEALATIGLMAIHVHVHLATLEFIVKQVLSQYLLPVIRN